MSARDDDPSGPASPASPASDYPSDPGQPARLLDDPVLREDVSAAWALGLLRSDEPYKAPAGRKQRVQLRLGHRPRPRAPLLLRLAVMAAVLFVGAGIVSAGLGHWPGWMARAYERVVGKPPAGHASTTQAPTAHTRTARRDTAPTEVPAAEVAPPAAAAQAETPLPPVSAAAPSSRAAHEMIASPRARRAIAAAPPASEDTSAVSAAMRALRVERNPVRARALLARYLGEHPNGNLAEEALALTIEAALAHHDSDVAALAARYLRTYPQGSFVALARQALVAQQSAAADSAE